jgi:hypothetical protein
MLTFSVCDVVHFLRAQANVLHMAFHTNHHKWERHGWFLQLRTLHYYHHQG